jgi:uncharacterized protein YjiK
VKLEPTRIEDVPVPELSGLALAERGAGAAQLLAIGDRKSVLAHAVLTDEPLDWDPVHLDRYGLKGAGQFEGVAVTGDGRILVLCESPPAVLVLDPHEHEATRIKLEPGRRGGLSEIFDEESSAGEGLLPLHDGRLLVAQEKNPPLLVEFGPRHADAAGVSSTSFAAADRPMTSTHHRLRAHAVWNLDGVGDISDLAYADGRLYCLSDQSKRVVVIALPLEPESGRAQVSDVWDLRVPERRGEPDGKPEGLVVTSDGTLIVGLDTETPKKNLCWYRP